MEGTDQLPMTGTRSKYFDETDSPGAANAYINQDVAEVDARQAEQAPGAVPDDIEIETQEPDSAITIESDLSNPTQVHTLRSIQPDVSEDLEEMLFRADGDQQETGKYVKARAKETPTESFMSGILDAAEGHDADGRNLGDEVAESEQEDEFDELLPASARR